jgi:colanic acid/amylovoran biosynthesis protein
MKRVLVHGYFRANLGDDLFFRVLAMRYPDVKFYLPTTRWDYRDLFRDVPNIKIIDFFKIAKLTSRKVYTLPKIYSRIHMKRFDAVVCIGGSLFIDRESPDPKHRIETENYSFICDWEYAKAAKVPYFVLGANWGPCYNDYFYDFFSRAFDSLTDLYFRDRASFDLFSDRPMVRRGGDILMGNPLVKDAAVGTEKKKQIAISVIDPGKKNDIDPQDYYRNLGELCRAYKAEGYGVKLLSFCKDEGDEDACRQVLKYAGENAAELAFYRGNWREMLRVMAESELLIATRFHATVLGWTLGVPVYTIAYSNKSVNLMADCGTESSCIPLEKAGNLDINTVKKQAALPEELSPYSGAEDAFLRLDKILR